VQRVAREFAALTSYKGRRVPDIAILFRATSPTCFLKKAFLSREAAPGIHGFRHRVAVLQPIDSRRNCVSSAGTERAIHDDRFVVAEHHPLPRQAGHDRTHLQDIAGQEGAVFVAIDPLTHGSLGLSHTEAQCFDKSADFVNSVVHDLPRFTDDASEQKGNN
jgi:hypothetical protein